MKSVALLESGEGKNIIDLAQVEIDLKRYRDTHWQTYWFRNVAAAYRHITYPRDSELAALHRSDPLYVCDGYDFLRFLQKITQNLRTRRHCRRLKDCSINSSAIDPSLPRSCYRSAD